MAKPFMRLCNNCKNMTPTMIGPCIHCRKWPIKQNKVSNGTKKTVPNKPRV